MQGSDRGKSRPLTHTVVVYGGNCVDRVAKARSSCSSPFPHLPPPQKKTHTKREAPSFPTHLHTTHPRQKGGGNPNTLGARGQMACDSQRPVSFNVGLPHRGATELRPMVPRGLRFSPRESNASLVENGLQGRKEHKRVAESGVAKEGAGGCSGTGRPALRGATS